MNTPAFFGHRHIFAIAVLLALLLSLPLLGNGLFLDDYGQRITLLSGNGGNAFEFFTRGNPVTEAQIQSGVLPWWTHAETKIRFFRPVAQWLMAVDYRFWPDNFVLMHLHSVLWYVLLCLIAALTYRQLMPVRWAAGLAAVLFAIDFGHAGGVAWLCNRNVLICLSSGLLCLLCHRREGAGWKVMAWALFCLGLASGESALAITGYLLAHEVFLAQGRWSVRILRLVPYALIALAWMAYWHQGGYGTAGPGFYIDPASNPVLFLQEMVYRAPAYLVGQFFLPPAEVFGALEQPPLRSQAMVPALVYAVTALLVLAWVLRPLLRRSALARFYALGLLVAVIPICGSALVSRALWYVGFGATGLLALYIQQYRELGLGPRQLRFGKLFAGTMLVLHLWLSPLLFVVMGKSADFLDGLMDSQKVGLPDAESAPQRLLLISSLSHVGNVTFPLLKDQALSLGESPVRPAPAIVKVRGLVEGQGRFILSRPDADTLVARAETDFASMRVSPYGVVAGDRFALDDVDIEIRSVSPKAAPIEIVYRFHPGALATYRVMAWQRTRFAPARLPEVGGSLPVSVEQDF